MKKEVLILYTMLSQEDRDKVDAQIRALFAKRANSPRTGGRARGSGTGRQTLGQDNKYAGSRGEYPGSLCANPCAFSKGRSGKRSTQSRIFSAFHRPEPVAAVKKNQNPLIFKGF